VGIREKHSHIRQPLHRWGVNLLIVGILGVELVSGTIPHTHIIGHKQDDIGAV
jgi:hypothetical protein